MLSWYIFLVLISLLVLIKLIPPIGCFFHEPKLKQKKGYKPNISIIIPSRNEKTIIKKVIESWLNTNYPKNKLELLFIDDSDDKETPKILEHYAKKYSFIKYIRGEGISKIAALQQGLKIAKYPYICINDADIVVHKDALKKLAEYIDNPNIGAVYSTRIPVYHSFFQIIDALWLFFLHVDQKFYTNVDSAPFVHMSPALFRKKDLIKIKFEKNIIADDLYIGVKLRQMGLKVMFLPKIAGGYVGSIGNLKELFTRNLRSMAGTIGISSTNYYKSMFNSKLGVFGWFSIPFRQLNYIARPLLFGLFALALVIDLVFLNITAIQIITIGISLYVFFILMDIFYLTALYFKIGYFDYKFLLILPLFPFLHLITAELTHSTGFFAYIFGKRVKWKKTTSDRVVD